MASRPYHLDKVFSIWNAKTTVSDEYTLLYRLIIKSNHIMSCGRD